MDKAILDNRLYVPSEYVTRRQRDAYTYYLTDPENDEELVVENFRDFGDFVGFSRGDLDKAYKVFKDLEVEDRRAMVPWDSKYKLKFRGKLRTEQKRLYHEWIEHGYGIVQAPPRFGKTIWTVHLVTRLRQRTLILVHRIDLANQWLHEFREFTNISELEEEHGEQLVGIWDKSGHFPIVTISTYQSFLPHNAGSAELKKMADMYGLVAVDECHTANAAGYARVLNRTNPEFRLGITATPYKSKDQLHVITHDTIGPVVTKGTEEALPVKYQLVDTGTWVKNYPMWSQYINFLAKDDNRNDLIAHWVIQDVSKGHYVLVTTDRNQHTRVLKERILEKDDSLIGKVEILNGDVPKRKREPLRERCRTGEIKVLIAMNSIVQLGYNVPRWSSLHNTMPMTNPENWYQRISRIRTPYSDKEARSYGEHEKPYPVCRVYVDKGRTGMVWGYINCVKKECEKLGFKETREALKPLNDLLEDYDEAFY